MIDKLIPSNNKILHKIFVIIFKTDTRFGKLFDIVLLYLILTNILIIMLESIPELFSEYTMFFYYSEKFFTLVFIIEYLLRIFCLKNPLKYVFSFYGIIDLVSIAPSFIGLFAKGTNVLKVIRAFRLLRVFRILKMDKFIGASNVIIDSLKESRHKISVFLIFILTLVSIIGTLMYVIEGPQHGFDSIPKSIYWAIVTMTTVGYGDIAPATTTGQFLASVVMILGYVIIAVPTGLVSAKVIKTSPLHNKYKCIHCKSETSKEDKFCGSCGKSLNNN